MIDPFKRRDKTDILEKHLKAGIATAKGVDGDFVYLTVGEAKTILRILDELQEYRKRMDDDGK